MSTSINNARRPWEVLDDEFLKASLSTMFVKQIASHLGRSEAAVYTRLSNLGLRSHRRGSVKPIGAERIRAGIPERKVSDTGNRKVDWKRIDVLEWEANNGPVPVGMVLIKQPGKPRHIENMQLASLAEVPLFATRQNASPQERRLLDLKSQFGFALSRIEKLNPQAAQSKGSGRHMRWSEADEAYLLAHVADQSPEEIASSLGRSRRAIMCKRTSMGLEVKKGAWSADEKSRLIANYQTASLAEMAVLFGRSAISIQRKCEEMGLRCRRGAEISATEQGQS